MNSRLCLWLFVCLFLMSGCSSPTAKNIHADEWIKVNKFTETIYSGD